jgi:predicted metal-dependent hydrolase
MRINASMNVIDFGARRITYNLHRQDRRRLRIVVAPELTVDVFVPEAADEEQIQAAVEKKAAWIARKLDALERYHPLPAPKKYISGESLVYLGRQYRLKVEQSHRQPAKLMGRFLWVWIEDRKNTLGVRKAVDSWYRKRAHETLGRYMERCHAIASRHGVAEPVLLIRTMLRRWGSCSPKGRITLNLNLVKSPVDCIEYVIIHELCHLKYHNHSKRFYSLLTRCQPDWRNRKEILDKFLV